VPTEFAVWNFITQLGVHVMFECETSMGGACFHLDPIRTSIISVIWAPFELLQRTHG